MDTYFVNGRSSLIQDVIECDVISPTQINDFIESGGDINHRDLNGNTALNHAIMRRQTELGIKLIECGANVNRAGNDCDMNIMVGTPYFLAVVYGDIEIVKTLIDENVDMRVPSYDIEYYTRARNENKEIGEYIKLVLQRDKWKTSNNYLFPKKYRIGIITYLLVMTFLSSISKCYDIPNELFCKISTYLVRDANMIYS